MAIWKIHYPAWEMECCGTPFSVGDDVEWIVQLEPPADLTPGVWEDCFTEVEGVLAPLSGEGEEEGAVLRAGGLTALWVVPPPYPSRARLSGLLSVSEHGPEPEEVPPTAGRVRGIQVVTQGFRESAPGSRTYVPVPGERWLRPEPTCPKWFGSFGEEERMTPGGAVFQRQETGVLVALETSDGLDGCDGLGGLDGADAREAMDARGVAAGRDASAAPGATGAARAPGVPGAPAAPGAPA
ncbi:DUF6578 domain-containing protein [Streptomyces sp. 8N706]|uniref:DUF6578 domain-containing protein n=1 Tax=Streptomyces sp. 8N706 TaxID=3457416 RepID=UPI003FD01D05